MNIDILRRAVGRPPKFDTVEEMQERFFEYVESLKEVKEVKDNDGKIVTEYKREEYPTVTGLALYLGFADKTSLYDYQKKPEFSHSVKVMRSFVENGYEKGLRDKSAIGSIFVLKCSFKWNDAPNNDGDATDIEVEM